MKINELVDRAFVVNLDRRSDRLAEAQKQFSMNGIEVERFSAVDGNSIERYPALPRGAAGCLESQLSIIKQSLHSGLSKIAIFEDDVFFVENFEEKFSNFYSQVPSDWQFIYLATNKYFAEVQHVSENVERVKKAWSAHAVILNRVAMELAVDLASTGDVPIDVYYGILQEYVPAYSAKPALAGQRPDYSDIENVFIDYNEIYGLNG